MSMSISPQRESENEHKPKERIRESAFAQRENQRISMSPERIRE